MGKKLTDAKREEIKQYYITQKASSTEVSKIFGIGTTTAKKIKKEIPEALLQEDDNGENKPTNYTLTQIEQERNKKILSEIEKYEDSEEGWTFHITKEALHQKKGSSRTWTVIAYDESAGEGWQKRLEQKCEVLGMTAAISPCHDKDKWDHDSPAVTINGEHFKKGERWKKGDKKKPHYHIILHSENRRLTWGEVVKEFVELLKCPYPQVCYDMVKMYQYFLHKNNPEKFQGYDKSDIVKLNGFSLELTKNEMAVMFGELLKIIRQERIECIGDLMELLDYSTTYGLVVRSYQHALITEMQRNRPIEAKLIKMDEKQLQAVVDFICCGVIPPKKGEN